MVAVLEIALVPTGDVVGVSVIESSGNVAFDRSAINAVEKAARFPEVKELERATFERDFRRFQLIFRPEDLRY
jgi:colicin import membrane protein